MLTDTEQKILDILKTRHVITKGELVMQLSKKGLNNNSVNVERLTQMGYIDKVESLGTCIVLTQKGLRAIEGNGG